MKKRKFDYDLVRFIAMMCVVLFHINLRMITNNVAYDKIFRFVGNNVTLGQFGVSLFFILSGATVHMSFTSLEKKYSSRVRVVLEYYKKRWLAIMPAFLVAYFLVHFTFRADFKPFGGSFIWTLLGMDGYLIIGGTPTCYIVGEWFVGAILLVYLCAPFLYALIRKFPFATAAGLVIYYFLIIRFYPFQHPVDANFITKIFDFGIGIYIGMYVNRIHPLAALAGLAVFLANRFLTIPLNTMYLVPAVGTGSFIFICYVGQKIQDIELGIINLGRRLITSIASLSFEVFLVHNVLITKFFSVITDTTIGDKMYLIYLIHLFIEFFFVAGAVSGLTAMIKKNVGSLFKPKKAA